ncbi:NADPH:quinone reductase [Streptomyces sp. DSM 44917]|uniref:NADPH:quinone reductase n=1 Tax=Streptomyces boetiae TaxID=3075541 RepID=A0ABU2L8C8_9ACTN|nr:NADPH:quinone reductase [Streptomyces sp. DSM 44917]MDT0307463.1 NADPH:quinone reductase [Streptomyces sp. DSM 44917]
MRAAYIERLGPPEEIRCGTLPDPEPGPGEVLVEVAASAVNPVDTLVRAGAFRTPVTFPFAVGRDLTGTVLAAGPGAEGFAPGERVWCNSLGHGGRQGAAAERAAVPSDRLYRLPPGADPVEAAAVLHPAATAWLALFRHAGLLAGETVLVAGAAGNVGSALVLQAARAGARVIATAHPRDEEYVRSLGAHEVLDYRRPAGARLRALCPDGIDVHVDTSGRQRLAEVVDLLAWRGRIVLLAGTAARPELPAGQLYQRDGSILGFVISRATTAELAGAAEAVNALLAEGALRARAVERLPLEAAPEAHARVENGRVRGGHRLVLLPGYPGLGAAAGA